jgi:hypothetical protein
VETLASAVGRPEERGSLEGLLFGGSEEFAFYFGHRRSENSSLSNLYYFSL